MFLIFSASSDAKSYHHTSTLFEPFVRWLFPQMPLTTIETLHFIVRKAAHMIEFALLAVLFWRAIRHPQSGELRQWRWHEAGLALGMVALCAASDEIHQAFVPGRTAKISDVVVDVTGAALGLLLLWLATKLLARRRHSTADESCPNPPAQHSVKS